MKISRDQLKRIILKEVKSIADEGKKNPKAKVRNRGDVVFPAESKLVSDDKDHFPINNLKQGRNALAQIGKYKSSPPWFKGSLKALKTKVKNKVHAKYKSIDVTEA